MFVLLEVLVFDCNKDYLYNTHFQFNLKRVLGGSQESLCVFPPLEPYGLQRNGIQVCPILKCLYLAVKYV